MDKHAAIEAAQHIARREGRELDRYARSSTELVDGQWFIGFTGNTPLPGNHFLVVVDDATGDGRVEAGH